MPDRTQNIIIDAFNRLISKYSFEKISVNMIVQEAHVSRATFYRHFKDKYEVMNYNYKRLLDHLSSPEQCHGFLELFSALFREAQNNWSFLRNATDTLGINSFGDYIYTYSYNLVDEMMRQNRKGYGLTEPEKLQCDVFCHGCSFMYQQWILGKYHLSPENAAQTLYDMMPEAFKHYWLIK